MTYGAKSKITLNTWDQFILPLPFTNCTINFGNRILVPHRSDEKKIKKKQKELEESLNFLTEASE
jgi:hypothetical protein